MSFREFTIEEVFAYFDRNGDGSVDKYELAGGLRALGCNPTEEEVEQLIEAADSRLNPNGRLEYHEFRDLMIAMRRSRQEEYERLAQAFRVFDRNGDGRISKDELKLALMTRGANKLTENEVEEIFAEADLDEDGYIDFEELVRYMMS